MVGVTGFEPATYTSRTRPAVDYTRLKLKIRQYVITIDFPGEGA